MTSSDPTPVAIDSRPTIGTPRAAVARGAARGPFPLSFGRKSIRMARSCGDPDREGPVVQPGDASGGVCLSRRVSKSGDGWLASTYNTTPAQFRAGLDELATLSGRDGERTGEFPNALATTWLFVTENPHSATQMITDVLAPMLGRDPDQIRALPLPIGPAEVCALRLSRYARAGAERIFLWPLTDHVRQLELFRERVIPLIHAGR